MGDTRPTGFFSVNLSAPDEVLGHEIDGRRSSSTSQASPGKLRNPWSSVTSHQRQKHVYVTGAGTGSVLLLGGGFFGELNSLDAQHSGPGAVVQRENNPPLGGDTSR